jgi:acetate kinase
MRILVANAGSSTLKLRVLDADDRLAGQADLPAPGGRVEEAALRQAVQGFGHVDVVGHRIVHGGGEFTRAVRVDDEVRRALEGLSDLAPLHQPVSLAVLAAVSDALPDVPAVACFDTAFHADLPAAAATYALPAEWRRRWGLRRYGFHGLSHAYAARRAVALAGGSPGLRVVSAHLGAGASLSAVIDGRSLDTTMGFTPLEGLVMATRCGSVDPGLILWLEQHAGVTGEALADALEHRSGLVGLAGTADMRELEASSAAGTAEATLALEVYLHRLRAGIAAMAAAMGGLDVLVFTGGVGEHSALLRARAADGLRFLGVSLDPERNQSGAADREIGAAGCRVSVFVVAAREDLEIAAQVRSVMDTMSAGEA